MDIFKTRTMNLEYEYVNYKLSIKTLLKQAALKIRIPFRSVIDFLADQRQPLKDTITGRSAGSNTRILILPKFSKTKMKSRFSSTAHNKQGIRANIIDFKLEKTFDLSQDSNSMSPAQIVFAVIHKQQVEWMKETEKKAG